MRNLLLIAMLFFIATIVVPGISFADEVEEQDILVYDISQFPKGETGQFHKNQQIKKQGAGDKQMAQTSFKIPPDKIRDKPIQKTVTEGKVEDKTVKRHSDIGKAKHYLSNGFTDLSTLKPGEQITLVGAQPAGPPINPIALEDIYSQNFNTVPPSGWATYSEGPDLWPWREEDNNNWAWCNSDEAGQGTDIKEWLYMTSGVNCSNFENIAVRFWSKYVYYDGDEYCKLLYATEESYPTFTTIARWDSEEDDHDWTPKTVPLPNSADGNSSIHIAFIYHGTYDWYWKVDDMVIIGDSPGPDILFQDNFEGDFPGNTWQAWDANPESGEDYWDDVQCGDPCQGSQHIWCADNGEIGCTDYEDDMNAWMVTSNWIDVTGYENITWSYQIKWDLETGGDYDYAYGIYRKADGTWWHFNADVVTNGMNSEWPDCHTFVHYNMENHINGNQFNVGFRMVSDYSIHNFEGVYVDHVLVTGTEIGGGIDDIATNISKDFSLSQNYPNPFNPTTTIAYDLPKQSHVNIDIYDILGRQVETLVNKQQPAGYHQAIWNANSKPSGMYFYKLKAGEFTETKKMLLLK
ncbi:MAG: T9SS type A sorting domain-containing protein [candidate division Zixibacteria bacterium]|nr:T9SS type A sorting domain-containing protein [candidate division Zixibacteria bacterium]